MSHKIYLWLAKILYFPIAKYFRFFAKIILARWNPVIIVVMGSAGKSNAHNLIYKLLQKTDKVRRSERANSAFAIPLDVADIHIKNYTPAEWFLAGLRIPLRTLYLLAFPYPHKYYVMELDVDRPNEMAFFASFIKPNVVFWVSSYATHTANFDAMVDKKLFKDTPTAIAAEFAKILISSPHMTAILNYDSVYIRQATEPVKIAKYLLRKDKGRYNFSNWEIFRKRTVCSIKLDKQQFQVELPFIAPRNFGYTILAAYIVAQLFKLDLGYLQAVLNEYSFNPGVCSILDGEKNTKIIDSSYNSSFYATISLLEVLKYYPGQRKIAVLGDMRELGDMSKQEHTTLAKKLEEYNFEQVVLVGPETQKYIYPILSESYKESSLHWFGNSYQAGLFIKERLLKPNDVVLLKASQNTLFFEIIAELLLENPEDLKLLCRRDPVWEEKRQEIKTQFYQKLNN